MLTPVAKRHEAEIHLLKLMKQFHPNITLKKLRNLIREGLLKNKRGRLY